MALRRPASQKNECCGGKASRAVDGNANGHWGRGTSSHTAQNRNVWWQVDLGKTYPVYMVLVHNRQDTAHDRIDNVKVYVVNGNQKQLCGTISWRKHVHVYPVSCGGKKGSKVRLENKWNYLTLAEVEVFATGGASPRNAAATYATYYTQHTGSELSHSQLQIII